MHQVKKVPAVLVLILVLRSRPLWVEQEPKFEDGNGFTKKRFKTKTYLTILKG